MRERLIGIHNGSNWNLRTVTIGFSYQEVKFTDGGFNQISSGGVADDFHIGKELDARRGSDGAEPGQRNNFVTEQVAIKSPAVLDLFDDWAERTTNR